MNRISSQIILSIFFLQCINIHDSHAQLSSKHYLPPLKQATSTIQGQVIYLTTPETTAFDVNIYLGTGTTAVATLSISNTSPGIYTPTGGGGENNTTIINGANAGIVLSNAGLRFEAPSGKKYYVNWRSGHGGQACSLVSAGLAALGTDFKWVGIPQIIPAAESSYMGANSVIGIMATEDNTNVTIYGYNPSCTFTKDGYSSGSSSITDDVITITLNAGQTYVLEAVGIYNTANLDGWLGATISSNKNIAVNQGHLNFKQVQGAIDNSMAQLIPTTNIGKEYVFIRGNGDDVCEFPVVIATKNNTEVYINNETTPYATLNNGQWVKIPSNKFSQSGTTNLSGANMYVRTTKDAYAVQSIAAGSNSGAVLDMFLVAPLNCLLDNGINKIQDVQKTGLTGTDLTSAGILILASSAISESNITVNYGTGSALTVATSTLTTARKTVSGTSDWVTYYIPNLTGDLKVNATGPIAVGYMGVSGVAGVAGYFSGFGTIPVIEVLTTGDGCFPNTTLTATSGFTSYAWYKDGVLLPSVTTNSFTPTVAGDYHVIVNNGSCSYPSSIKTVYNCNPEVLVNTITNNKYLLPGESTTFTISVKLLGGSAAQNLQISNLIPAHLTYNSSTVTKGSFSGSGSSYTWNIGTMTNGEENILTVTATAQSVTSTYVETYTTNNTQTFSLGTESNVLPDDKTEEVVIFPACTNSLAGTISGNASYCSSTNSTSLTLSGAYGELQWQSSSDNVNFSDVSGATTGSLLVTNLSTTTYYRVKATLDACVAYATSVPITIGPAPAGTLTSAAGSNAQSVCNNTVINSITYSTSNASGAAFSGLPAGVSGNFAGGVVTISGTPSASGTFNYTATLSGACNVDLTGSIVVVATNTITLTSASATTSQSVCVNSAITTISYSTTGATGANFSGLPAGVTGAWVGNVVTISGTPTAAGSYNFTINLVGGCGSVSEAGTISVANLNQISLTSAVNTDAQSVCESNALTPITYSTTGATGANITGLPSGVTGSWSANTITISGTPVSSANYTITLTGGCGTVTRTGVITVLSSSVPATLTITGDACINKTTLSVASGLTSYTWYKDNIVITGASSHIYTPTAAGVYKVTVSNGTCSNTSTTTTISTCGITSDGRMVAVVGSTTMVNKEGAINSGKGLDERGVILTTPYVYQNVVTTYDGSTTSGWINGYGTDNQLVVSNIDGNPVPSFYGAGPQIRSFRRDFGRAFKNSTIEFDIKISSGRFGFNFGVDVDGKFGFSLELQGGGTASRAGLYTSENWFYPGIGSNSYAFNPSTWYSIKIVTEDGTSMWYVNNILQGTYATTSLGLNQYFGVASENATFYIDNIKVTY